MRPGAIPGSPVGDEPADAEPSTSDSHLKSGTRTHPATIAMREGLRGEANEMVKSILAAVLGSAEMWSRDVIEVRILLVLYCMSIWSEGNQAKFTLHVPGFDHHIFRAVVLHISVVLFPWSSNIPSLLQ